MRFVSAMLFALVLFTTTLTAAPDTSLFARRAAMSRVLDSLEFEKQLGKRQGKALDGLEQRCRLLRDSLDLLRASAIGASFSPQDTQAAADGSLPPVLAEKPVLPPLLKLLVPADLQDRAAALIHPRTFFDWFILLVSVIAIGSGLILLLGIVGAVRDKMRHPRVKRRGLPGPASSMLPARQSAPSKIPSPPKNAPAKSAPVDANAAALDLLSRLKDVKPVATEPPKSPPVLPSAPAPVASSGTDSADPLQALRMRMRGEEPVAAEQPPAAHPDPVVIASEVPMRQQVVDAHGLGLTAPEIAKGLHLSLDQVNLILRVHGLHH